MALTVRIVAGARVITQLSCDPTTQVNNKVLNAGTDAFNAVNPNGINGRYNSANRWVNQGTSKNLSREGWEGYEGGTSNILKSTVETTDFTDDHGWPNKYRSVKPHFAGE